MVNQEQMLEGSGGHAGDAVAAEPFASSGPQQGEAGLRQVLIEVNGRLAHVQPPDDEVVNLCAVEVGVNDYEPGGKLGYRLTRVRRRLDQPFDDHGRLILPARAVPLVKKRLVEAGFAVEVRVLQRPDPAWEVCESALVQAPPPLRALLHAVADRPFGVFEVAREATFLDATALVCSVYPIARVFILAATRRRVRQLNVELERRLGFAVGVAGSRQGGEGFRVVVGTPGTATQNVQQYRHAAPAVGAEPIGADDGGPGRDVLLVADAEQFATEASARALLESRAPRAYAFLQTGRQLDPLKRFYLNLLFGPIRWREAGRDGFPARVRVLFAQPDRGPVAKAKTPLERKRLHVWRNDRRNDFLAALADALARRDRHRLWEHGLFLEGDGDEFFAELAPSVLVLVESPEHGRELLKRLPGWGLQDAVPRKKGVPEPAVDPFAVGPLHQTILTLAEASTVKDNDDRPKLDTDVLVRADGTEWPLELPGFPPRTGQATREVLLIDLVDDQDREARAATRRRLRDYRRRGWNVERIPACLRQEQG